MTNEIDFKFTAPSNIRPWPAPPAFSASSSHAACDIPAPYFCPACNPGCTDCAVLLQSAHKSSQPFLSSTPQTIVLRSLSRSVPIFSFHQPALPADLFLLHAAPFQTAPSKSHRDSQIP